jgi:hypothetical protein
VCLAELLDFEMPALCCSVPGFKRKHVSINVMTRLFRNYRPCCAGARGGRVAQASGNAHQFTREESECNLTFAMCLTLLQPHPLRTWLISLTNPIIHQAALAVWLAAYQTFNVLV